MTARKDTNPTEPAFKGLIGADKEIDAARRFVLGILKRKHVRPEIVAGLNGILKDIAHLPGRLPEHACELTISAGYGDEDIGGTEYHTFVLDDTHFELSSGGSSFSGPVDSEDFIDAFRFVAESDGFVERKMDVTGWIAEVEECCADPAYYLEIGMDEDA
jgi:hypothetical protein